MFVEVAGRPHDTGLTDLTVYRYPGTDRAAQTLYGLTEHDLYDLEWALAQRRAMGKTCPALHGEHTCCCPPGHGHDHQCRACDFTWLGL
jgi:hypothetical protein